MEPINTPKAYSRILEDCLVLEPNTKGATSKLTKLDPRLLVRGKPRY